VILLLKLFLLYSSLNFDIDEIKLLFFSDSNFIVITNFSKKSFKNDGIKNKYILPISLNIFSLSFFVANIDKNFNFVLFLLILCKISL
jgi:hypothetical protein